MNAKRKACEELDREVSDEETAGAGSPLPIEDVLNRLHKTFPANNYPRYHEKLVENGLHYGHSVFDVEAKYFKNKIRMSDGIIREFLRSTKNILQASAGQGKEESGLQHEGKKRKKVKIEEKENVLTS
jgi:hypothetical protein